MFRITPDENNLIALCRVWGGVDEGRRVNDLSVASDRLMLVETNGTLCHKYFQARKFFIQSKICYSFTPKVTLEWNLDQFSNILHVGLKGYFYMIAFNSSFVGKKFSVLATSPDALYGHSSMWSSDVLEEFNFSSWHIVSYMKYIQQVLPPPYSDGGFTHMMHMKCIYLCINNLLEPFNKSLTSIFTIPSDRKFITYADRVVNGTFNSWVNGRLEYCEHQCKFVRLGNFESEMEFTVTEITRGRASKSSTFKRTARLTSFYLRRSDSPVVVIIFKAQISFFEFLITLGSIISIWFGLSVRSIPRSLMRTSVRAADEVFHELRLKINIMGRFIRNI